MIEIGAQAQSFLYDARTGIKFVFGGRATPITINQLRNAGYVEEVPRDDPHWSPGLYVWTRAAVRDAKLLPHRIEIVSAPKMDAPDLVSAHCSCGYESAPNTEVRVRNSWANHVNSKKHAS